jgi:serine/threonine protein phosphatase PrpC
MNSEIRWKNNPIFTNNCFSQFIEKSLGTSKPTLKGAADSLVDAANRMGGKDNISVILVRM